MDAWRIIGWWEIRRVPYNAALLVIGFTSVLAMESLMGSVIPVGEDAIEPLGLAMGVLFYGVMANLFYTSGWILELGMRRASGTEDRSIAKRAFMAGLCFSCLLTTAPLWFGLAFWLVNRDGTHG